MTVTIRHLTRQDLVDLLQIDALPGTVRGFAVEENGVLRAIAGLLYFRSFVLAFAEMPPDVEKYPVAVVKMARRMQELMRTVKAPIYAEAAEAHAGSGRLLEYIGFRHVEGSQYRWSNT
jgi:hypothetical protein